MDANVTTAETTILSDITPDLDAAGVVSLDGEGSAIVMMGDEPVRRRLSEVIVGLIPSDLDAIEFEIDGGDPNAFGWKADAFRDAVHRAADCFAALREARLFTDADELAEARFDEIEAHVVRYARSVVDQARQRVLSLRQHPAEQEHPRHIEKALAGWNQETGSTLMLMTLLASDPTSRGQEIAFPAMDIPQWMRNVGIVAIDRMEGVIRRRPADGALQWRRVSMLLADLVREAGDPKAKRDAFQRLLAYMDDLKARSGVEGCLLDHDAVRDARADLDRAEARSTP